METSKRILVTFTSEQVKLLDLLKGEMGKGDAEVVRNIVLTWLSEKSFISTNAKQKMQERVERK